MAAWQADFVVIPAGPLPENYREVLGGLLPPAPSWHAQLEVWGTDDGDRIDVFNHQGLEIVARFDLREWKPALYAAFLAFVQGIGGRLQAESGEHVPLVAEAFQRSLLVSDAARFVKDPSDYLDGLTSHPVRMPEEP